MQAPYKIRGRDVTYALLDAAFAVAPVYRSFPKGKRPSGLFVEYTHGGTEFLITGGDWLDVRDQSILLACVGLAGLHSSQQTHENNPLLTLAPCSDPQPLEDKKTVEFTATRYTLLKAANIPTRDDDYDRLKESLHRLGQISCMERKNGGERLSHWLTYDAAPNERVQIVLNWRFAHAMSDGHYVKICMQERRKLSGETAKLLHAAFSGVIREGSKGYWTGLDTVSQRIYGPISKVRSTQRSRRLEVQGALEEIAGKIGWRLEFRGEGARSQFQIYRPRPRTN